MSGVLKFSWFLVVLFGLLAVTSSSEFDDDDEDDLRDFEDDLSDGWGEEVRGWQHYQWQQPVAVQHHYGNHHQYPQPVKVVPQVPKCNNLPQCKPCKAPSVPSYQPKSSSARRAQRYLEEQNQFEESRSEAEYETRYQYQQQQYYYKTTQPPRPRQCSDVCKPPVPVTTQKPPVQPPVPIPTQKPYVQPHYQQHYPQHYQHHYQQQQNHYQYRPFGYGR